MVKIKTLIFPYFFKNFPEKTVKIEAEITPIVIKTSPFTGFGAVGSTNSLKQKYTPEKAINTDINFDNEKVSILKIHAIIIVKIGIVAYKSPALDDVVISNPRAMKTGKIVNINIPINTM